MQSHFGLCTTGFLISAWSQLCTQTGGGDMNLATWLNLSRTGTGVCVWLRVQVSSWPTKLKQTWVGKGEPFHLDKTSLRWILLWTDTAIHQCFFHYKISLVLGKEEEQWRKTLKKRNYFGFSHWKNKTQIIYFYSDVLLEGATCLVSTKTGPETEKVNSWNQDSQSNSSQLSLVFY